MREVFAICADVQGTAAVVETAPYFTDASAPTPSLGGVPTVILGPGHAPMAHQTDEWCECARVEEAVAIYARLIGAWCGFNTTKQDPSEGPPCTAACRSA
jgi:succinyl-diaminopimelate desuccinylase